MPLFCAPSVCVRARVRGTRFDKSHLVQAINKKHGVFTMADEKLVQLLQWTVANRLVALPRRWRSRNVYQQLPDTAKTQGNCKLVRYSSSLMLSNLHPVSNDRQVFRSAAPECACSSRLESRILQTSCRKPPLSFGCNLPHSWRH